jgi:hypothetical protein
MQILLVQEPIKKGSTVEERKLRNILKKLTKEEDSCGRREGKRKNSENLYITVKINGRLNFKKMA